MKLYEIKKATLVQKEGIVSGRARLIYHDSEIVVVRVQVGKLGEQKSNRAVTRPYNAIQAVPHGNANKANNVSKHEKKAAFFVCTVTPTDNLVRSPEIFPSLKRDFISPSSCSNKVHFSSSRWLSIFIENYSDLSLSVYVSSKSFISVFPFPSETNKGLICRDTSKDPIHVS